MELIYFTIFFFALLKAIFCLSSVSPFCTNADVQIPCDNYLGVGVVCKAIVIRPTKCSSEALMRLRNSISAIPGKDLGKVSLSSYLHSNPGARAHFNVNATFSNIKWTDMIMRFSVEGTGSSGVRCRHFVINSTLGRQTETPYTNNLPNSLFWDCRWFEVAYEGRYMTLEIIFKNEYFYELKKFLFHLPKYQNLGFLNFKQGLWEQELFVYVEEHGEDLIAHWAQPPLQLNISTFRVNVSGCSDFSHTILWMVTENSLQHRIEKFQKTCLTKCCIISVEPWLSALQMWGSPSLSVPLQTATHPMDSETGTAAFVVLMLLLSVALICSCTLYALKCHTPMKEEGCHCMFPPFEERGTDLDLKDILSNNIEETQDQSSVNCKVDQENVQFILKIQNPSDEGNPRKSQFSPVGFDEERNVSLSDHDFIFNLIRESVHTNDSLRA